MRLFLILVLLAALPGALMAGNRLADAPSPYLSQHANNPVNWYPWGTEALEKARREGRPVFVSVGYSTCYWCRVMEEESFANQKVADILNAHFIAIKVDREQRPDLDERFILVTSMLAGTAGWPNNVFLTPEGEPFHGAGYMPRKDFMRLLKETARQWQARPETIRAEAAAIAERLRDYLDQPSDMQKISQNEILALARTMLDDFDSFSGGFGTAPKFPREMMLLLLLDQAERSGDPVLLEAALTTLDGMIRGGIHDHPGGGFHRYAVDPEWHVPHFEKMLYNQALIGRALLRAHVLTGRETYARAARRTLDFALRELQAEEGAFHAALDAGSPGPEGHYSEGAFYVWSPARIRAALSPDLPPDLIEALITAFGVSEHGLAELDGESVLHLQSGPAQAAAELGLEPAAFDRILEILRKARETRPRPLVDEKIIVAWNGEMIATLAEAGWLLDAPEYTRAATRAAEFILNRMWTQEGLRRVWFNGQAGIDAQLADHAALGLALLALYDFSGPPDDEHARRWLAPARRLADEMQARFAEPGLPMRMLETPESFGPFRPLDDTELASGNALALSFLNRLDRRDGQMPPRAQAPATVLSGHARRHPVQRAGLLAALAEQIGGATGPLRYSPGGAVRLSLKRNNILRLSLRTGWHINAHRPHDENLIATVVSVNGTPLPASHYPAPVLRRPGFSPKPLALYEKTVVLPLPPLRGGNGAPARISATIQACSDQICLQPENIGFLRW